MYILTMIVHVVVCIFLIIVVLLQSGKAADLAGAFGGMGSQTAFGPRGSATLLSKATTVSAVLFMFTSLALSILATRSAGLGTTVLEDTQQKSAPTQAVPPPAPSPVVPAPATPGSPITVTPNGGKPIQLTIPAGGGQVNGGKPIQLNIPAPGTPAPAPAKQAPAPAKK
ncbi:MAG TPA: preprotein translocase subunit SecG [Verrucomicrobiae bacterium]|nr:preprotein translocase subunit SecG [Verrucomicrobiae bacterium]